MTTVVIGPGYTGHRVVAQVPGCIGLSRRELDLDAQDPVLPDLPDRFALLYTVPPRSDSSGDSRLAQCLDLVGERASRFVYLSTTGVYGNTDGAPVDETSPLNPEVARAERRVAAESLLHSWQKTTGNTVIILRVPGIYGPGRLGLERIKAGQPILSEADAGPGNRIHVDDLVRACAQALGSSNDAPPDTSLPPAGVYNLGDGDHRSASWFAKTVARHAGLPAPPEISLAEAENVLSPGRLSFLRASRTVQTAKAQSMLGFKPEYSNAEDGICASLDNSAR